MTCLGFEGVCAVTQRWWLGLKVIRATGSSNGNSNCQVLACSCRCCFLPSATATHATSVAHCPMLPHSLQRS